MRGTARTAGRRCPATPARLPRGYAAPTAAILAALLAALACGSRESDPRIPVVDLIGKFRLAEARPSGTAFQLAQHTLDGEPRATVVVPVPSRLIWTLPVPRRAVLRVIAALPRGTAATVRFRIGVSDHRIYEALAETTLTGPGQTAHALNVDLSDYAGIKWSLFYRPDTRDWRLVLSTDAITAGAPGALWVEPAIHTDVPAARHYFHTRLVRK